MSVYRIRTTHIQICKYILLIYTPGIEKKKRILQDFSIFKTLKTLLYGVLIYSSNAEFFLHYGNLANTCTQVSLLILFICIGVTEVFPRHSANKEQREIAPNCLQYMKIRCSVPYTGLLKVFLGITPTYRDYMSKPQGFSG